MNVYFKMIIKRILSLISKYSNIVNNYYNCWGIIGNVPSGIIIVNFIFQRILKINSEVGFSVHFTTRIVDFRKIRLHKDKNTITSFVVSSNCYIQSVNGIEIGKNFLFASGLKLISANHDFREHNKSQRSEPIIIGDNVWAGTNVVILPGVRIGNNCIIGAGSVVTKSFTEENLIIVGNPAKVIRRNEIRV